MFKDELTVQSIARTVSRLTGILTGIPLVIFLMMMRLEAEWNKKLVFLAVFLLLGWVAPVSYFIWALGRGWVKDLDATDRRDRYVPYTLGVVCWTVLLVVTRIFLPPEFLRSVVPFYLLGFALFVITFVYKISVHAALNTALYLIINEMTAWMFWWLFPFVLLVCWARWVSKKHTVVQLLLGVVVAFVIWAIF